MNKKGIKTSIVAFIILIAGLALTASLVFDKIDIKEFGVAMGTLSTLGVSVIGFLSKDADKSHTNNS